MLCPGNRLREPLGHLLTKITFIHVHVRVPGSFTIEYGYVYVDLAGDILPSAAHVPILCEKQIQAMKIIIVAVVPIEFIRSSH